LKALEGVSLEGIRVVADCANGAAYFTTPEALRRAGAEVIVMNAEPDGSKINVNCGSTNTDAVAARVLKEGAHAGLAHDGDADRVIAVDEKGQTVDGDAIIAATAADLAERGRLDGNIVVTTVMANLGFREAMKERGIEVVETDVGDRYVVEAMKQRGAVIGGEQSGHVIFREYATTGDGLITALRLLSLLRGGRPLSEVASIVRRYPQVLVNVRVNDKGVVSSDEASSVISEVAASLGDSGRVLVRPSGTEPLVRVMVEATQQEAAQAAADRIAEAIRDGGGA
ncbi:MAG TPA: phosphoglucosamine mutase, partial [Actinomycetota bacterium]|nr:phosphoglucosamine mutase [Actinomycetota bacterium]